MEVPPPEGRIVTETRGRVRMIGVDRPAKYNGFTPEMVEQLARLADSEDFAEGVRSFLERHDWDWKGR